ncbi:MAG TPA: response regulator [Stenotrophomonas sp.]|nr:response regulator [Stenotrophomonas sp.]
MVEDHPTNRTLIALQLRELGYPHVIADDGLAALMLLDRLLPSLVLTDISMPHMDGHTLARRIRERERERHAPRLPIIAMTANVLDQGTVDGAADLDAQIHKPVNLAQLAQVLGHWLPAPTLPSASAQALQLRERMGAHLQPLLRTFLDSTALDRAAVAAAVDRGDATEVSRRIHRIAGALGYFGYTDLAIAGRDLSNALEQASLTKHRNDCENFLRELTTVCTELAGLLEPTPQK